MIKVVLSSLAKIGYTTSIMTHKRMKRWIILKKCPFSFHQLSYDTLSVQLYSCVYTLHGCVSHPSYVCVSRFSGFHFSDRVLNCLCGEILFLIERGQSQVLKSLWPCGCFFCSDQLVCLPIRLLARETIPGPERKKNEVAFR